MAFAVKQRCNLTYRLTVLFEPTLQQPRSPLAYTNSLSANHTVTVLGYVVQPATQANSASYLQRDGKYVPAKEQ